MRRIGGTFRSKLTYANVVATLALFGVVAGGGAYAQSKIGSSQIAAKAIKSKHVAGSAVRSRHLVRGAVTAGKVRAGAIGSARLAPNMRPMWARVGETGNLVAGRGAVSAERTATGRYRVTFVREVQGCSWTATVGRTSTGGGTSFGYVDGGGYALNEHTIVVVTRFGSTHQDLDRPFHLQVLC